MSVSRRFRLKYSQRSEPEVASDILKVANHWTSISHLFRNSNLNSIRIQKYLAVLLEKGYLEKMRFGDRTFYKTTEKGLEYIQLAKQIVVFEKNGLETFIEKKGMRR